jgi:hypothetical protein
MKGRILSVAMAALAVLVAAFVVFPEDGGEGRDRMNRTRNTSDTARSPVPAIDRVSPAKTETAIFALG